MTSGILTSVLIIAACFAGLHTIVDLRRAQARQLGVPYMDKYRRGVLLTLAAVTVLYVTLSVVVSAADW